MSDDNWSMELGLLESRGCTLAPGLTGEEFEHAESAHGFRFPPDLRSFLAQAMPVSGPQGTRFPDWRSLSSDDVIDRMSGPAHGIAFDIENNGFWWAPWGSRPRMMAEAIDMAMSALERVPKLIPILGHRYLPADPPTSGNPVFSVHQTDIIYYGLDLRRYIACEFGLIGHAEAVQGDPRHIAFWSDLEAQTGRPSDS